MENIIKKEIIREAERIRINCVYKATAHFKAAAYWSRLKFLLGIPITILAAITSGLALSSYHEVTGIFALSVSILSAITTFLEPNENRIHILIHRTAIEPLRTMLIFFAS